ncbi:MULTISPECIES: hydrolase [Brevibacterium]|uniref:Isochorismatase hydrolase n=4 Tax=Brevibacterium TaxID=1696 RepID=K9AHQ7_9MICO|nr:hydrolase [Brevibacterium casei]NJE66521.1 hydrolase [Brevibacterium sp. LS14]SII77651.1 Isochorismatase family [Mycobacteroides abscessus subsp. abscessus]EKU45651.1 isochorismatase hydrolase [Brevibacterium casei S18]MBE4695189.1 hydrolase [Brevibacterium casei]MBY3578311.1 hydrolase [Brevibacterium casei]
MPKNQPEPVRDPASDHLLTPSNCAIALIDYQPEQFSTVGSTTRDEILLGVVTLAKLSRAYEIPTVLSTVGVDLGVNTGTISEIKDELPDLEEIDRTGVNSWEDADFRAAIEATGRKKIVLAGLWTEVCLTFPTLDLLKEGYEVYPVIDAVGGVSDDAHNSAVTRMVTAGAHPITSLAFGAELMRNWARSDSDRYRTIINDYFQRRRAIGDTFGN